MGNAPDTILSSVRNFFKGLLEKMMLEEREIYLDSHPATKANGYYERTLSSCFGDVPDLQIPRSRDSQFRSVILPKGQTESKLKEIIFQLYSAGISTRRIEDVLLKHFSVSLSHASIARLANVAYEEVRKWKNRNLAQSYAVIFIDAFFFPIKRKTVETEAVYVAMGINPEGHREVLGFWLHGGTESATNWEENLREIQSRGVKEVEFVAADGLAGIKDAIQRVYPNAKYQYCVLHATRSSLNKVRASDKKEVSLSLKAIYLADSREEAKKELDQFIHKWKPQYPKVTEFWEMKFESLTNFMALPNKLWSYVYTTNCVERLHKEVKRRIKSMEQFQNEISAEKILYCIYKEQNEKYKNSGVNGWRDLYGGYKKKELEKSEKIIALKQE